MFSKFVLLEMPRSTTRSRKRKFQGNQFSQSQEKSSKKALKFAEVRVDDAKPSGSVDTGKCLDVEVLSKVCHACQKHENEEDSVDKRLWQADHQGKCKATIKALLQQWRLKGSNVSLNVVRRRTNFATLNTMATVTAKDSLKLRTLTKTRV